MNGGDYATDSSVYTFPNTVFRVIKWKRSWYVARMMETNTRGHRGGKSDIGVVEAWD
jgi:hypothetical protein